MEPERDRLVYRHAAGVVDRIRRLRDEARSIQSPPHPRAFASEIAEQYPYRTDFLNAWTPQYVKPASMWERDHQRAYVAEGVERAIAELPADLRQDVRSRLGWSRPDLESLRSPTVSAGMAPPWSGAARIAALLSPFKPLTSLGQMATDAALEAAGEPGVSPEATSQFANAIDGLTYPISAYAGRRPAHLRAYDDWVRQQRSKPMWDMTNEPYEVPEDLDTANYSRMVGKAFPNSPVAAEAGGFVLEMLTDPFVPYAGLPARTLPAAFAKDMAGATALSAPFFGAALALQPDPVRRQEQEANSLMLRRAMGR